MPVRAVVFDLWDTIVEFVPDDAEAFHRQMAEQLDVPPDRLREVWYSEEAQRSRNVGPIGPCLAAAIETLEVEADVEELARWRCDHTLTSLVPRAGLLETLAALRARGIKVGLVSNCTEDVALVWRETSFAHYFDVAIFSATAGCAKPEPEIYRLATAGLGVDPSECLFVGDGANDELRGAERAGLTPVLIHRHGEEPYWGDVRDWEGHRITAIPQVLDLVR